MSGVCACILLTEAAPPAFHILRPMIDRLSNTTDYNCKCLSLPNHTLTYYIQTPILPLIFSNLILIQKTQPPSLEPLVVVSKWICAGEQRS